MNLNRARLYYMQVDWEKRLQHELPFFRELIKKYNVKTLLDLGCGPGMHAITLAQQLGVSVVGVDVDADMLEVARENVNKAGLEDKISFIHGDIFAVPDVMKVDAMICLGNALGIILTDTDAKLFFKKVSTLINEGGFFFAQQLNPENPRNGYMVTRSLYHEDLEIVLLKRFEPRPDGILADFVYLSRELEAEGTLSPQWTVEWQSNLLRMNTKTQLEKYLLESGFSMVEAFSNYNRKPFDPSTSDSLLILALK